MLERRSALASVAPYASAVLQIGEARGFSLVQAAVFTKAAAEGHCPYYRQVAGKSWDRA